MEENEETVITSMTPHTVCKKKALNDNLDIRATDVTLGLRRVPAGFHTVVHHSGLEWRTESRSSPVNNDVIDWSGPIPM